MSGKVYVVTSGTYSDYGIVAIFWTPEKAEEYCEGLKAQYKYSDINSVEEYDLDQPREELPGAFRVTITETGATVDDPWWSETNTPNYPARLGSTAYGQRRLFYGYGLTVEHARRSAEELRRQTLALEGKVVAARQSPEGKD